MINWKDEEEYDYEEEPDEQYEIISWMAYDPASWKNRQATQIYLVEDVIKDKINNIIIFCENHKFDLAAHLDLDKFLIPLSKDKIEKYIYTNKCPIWIWIDGDKIGRNYFWKDIPKYIKDKI